jgi:hypothetical protein
MWAVQQASAAWAQAYYHSLLLLLPPPPHHPLPHGWPPPPSSGVCGPAALCWPAAAGGFPAAAPSWPV